MRVFERIIIRLKIFPLCSFYSNRPRYRISVNTNKLVDILKFIFLYLFYCRTFLFEINVICFLSIFLAITNS